jgi:protein-disulfide isomerase
MKRLNTRHRSEANPPRPVEGRDHIQGPIGARFELLEYGDYQCPYCGAAFPMVKALQERLGEQLCFAFRNFPLSEFHEFAEHAAEAAEAAGDQGKFWEMHDRLYENQDALDDRSLARHAADLDLNAVSLMREVSTGKHAARIQDDFQSGVRNGVNGTPTFFVNGERYDGAFELEAMLAALSARVE